MKLKVFLALAATIISANIFASDLKSIDCYSGSSLIYRQDGVYIDFLPNNVIVVYQDSAKSNVLQLITGAACIITPIK